ncbi:positive regulator of purine utilization, putative [Coccidioides posadasii C735 delta SOWgp]|uniref:C6 transcription factor n=3 Tax=Coccidioides posadasii TaxID=199306 RepID=E9CXV1_COCPS|nr:positive regulator of purine utilization, putative [Coccidioides posadasii C735 delta SOWgp]EER26694.1 positive regulator of purine utilization, putative [Coccidioides posadasii C735 delta SOWgp]EFW20778.1 C6 transcription factor [Coccidioides posadasii str. Silveira]KMM72665.1 transcription factor uaY-like protein [Coccidioides posadasii RMSCC 3488]|eukprot:XP_003068839.1 positive regulator of purine utilization, putative [Coccidioides posadasii C735 delta SOWgp]
MLNTARTQLSTSPTRIHSGTKRPYPSDETDVARPCQKAFSHIDRPTQTSPVDSSPVKEQKKAPRNASDIFPSFRSVTACHRCRSRKNRCDQRLPRCHQCEKAGVPCVGFDPITKREIPRSYVHFLESRVIYLEKVLSDNGIEFSPPEPHEGEARSDPAEGGALSSDFTAGGESQQPKRYGSSDTEGPEVAKYGADVQIKDEGRQNENRDDAVDANVAQEDATSRGIDRKRPAPDSSKGLDSLVSKIGLVPVHGASDSRYLGSTSGISFARVVFAAVRSSITTSTSDRGTVRPSSRRASTGQGNAPSSMRDSFFGLQVRPSMNRAPFPDRAIARRLVDLYFEHANPQAPILHRGEFMELFERVYATDEKNRSPGDLYALNIVCAIGAGIIFEVKRDITSSEHGDRREYDPSYSLHPGKPSVPSSNQSQPEEYHASAIVHLEASFSSSSTADGFVGGLEELQAVLLLASFALLRPVAPGLWYIVGVAMRLAIDLGLHHEDGTGLDFVDESITGRKVTGRETAKGGNGEGSKEKPGIHARERGRREWVRDLRRRLWWSVYSFDRLVSTCVGRPFGISDEVITTEFPSLLDDKYITRAGFLTPPSGETPSYKHVSYHYFKLRLLQSEIQQVLQYQQARIARKSGIDRSSDSMRMDVPSPFLQKFDSFRSWRRDVHSRLDAWIQSSPTQRNIGVQFSIEFLELNYWQALTMLYRQSLVVPARLAADLGQTGHAMSPTLTNMEDEEDPDDIYLKVAEAGKMTLRLYRQLHRVRLVNYTYLATHHLFMAGISFLCAIWHSPVVRSHLALDDVDFTVLGATSVLEDLMGKCPPAEACRDAFEMMSKATVQVCLSTTGFGSSSGRNGTRPALPGKPRQDDRPLLQAPDGQNSNPLSSLNIHPASSSSEIVLDGRMRPGYQPDSNQSRQAPLNRTPALNHMGPSDFPGNYPMGQSSSPIAAGNSFINAQQSIYNTASSPHSLQQQPGFGNPFPTQSPQQAPTAAPLTSLPSCPEQSLLYHPELDFLNCAPRADHEQLYSASTGQETDTFSLPSPFPNSDDPPDTAVDLGFGMTLGLQHDWSNGSGYPFFGDFFFGNGTGGS